MSSSASSSSSSSSNQKDDKKAKTKGPSPWAAPNSTLKDLAHVSIVILGASGDLAKRKLYPALYSLSKEGCVPQSYHVVGYARSELSSEELVKRVKPFIVKNEAEEKAQAEHVQKFFSNCGYVSGKYDSIEDFGKLNDHLNSLEAKVEGNCHRMFFLSLPPDVFLDAATCIGKTCRATKGWTRIVVEKPFGKDLQSFEVLSKGLNANFKQNEIYRIDHYIGKEVVQNLLVLRFANVIFDPLWSRSNIKSIQIIFKEQLGVEGRGGYFDNYGIIRDVMQNHLMQILTLITMEPPTSLSPEDISSEKLKVLKSIAELKADDLVIGQYQEKNISGKLYPGYTQDESVPENSLQNTFAACVLKIKNRRWDGVPILMKCGKALDERLAEIRIQFNEVPANLYQNSKTTPNELVIRIQPDEAIYFKLMNKVVGFGNRLVETQLDFTYKTKYANEIPDAYARLLVDVLEGNESNFINEEELRIQWKIFDAVLKEIDLNRVCPEPYAFGSRGPVMSDYLAAKYGVRWMEK